MGVAARKYDTSTSTTGTGRARLHLVPSPANPSPRAARGEARARARAEETHARAVFTTFAVVLAFVVLLGGVRVMLITNAAEASLSEDRIQASIKQQRAEADQLEVDRSALSTPSRIADIASSTMRMGEPKSVRYISMPHVSVTAQPGTSGQSASTQEAAAAPTGILSSVVGAVIDLSAGEAQSLLVGDLGLAGSR